MSAEPDGEPQDAGTGELLRAAVPIVLALLWVAIEVWVAALLVALPFTRDGASVFAVVFMAPFVLGVGGFLFVNQAELLTKRSRPDTRSLGWLRTLSNELFIRVTALVCGLLMLCLIALSLYMIVGTVMELADGIDPFDVVFVFVTLITTACSVVPVVGLLESVRFLVGGRLLDPAPTE